MTRLDALKALAEKVAAGELAVLVAELIESDSDHETEWDADAKIALAALRKAMEEDK